VIRILELTYYLKSSRKGGAHHTMSQKTLKVPRVTMKGDSWEDHVEILQVSMGDTWMTPYVCYLADTLLPSDPRQVKFFQKNAG